MPELDAQRLWEFVNSRIEDFHDKRIERLARLELNDVLKRKNPYLFKAKHLQTAPALVESILDAHISSSEEKMFGDFLEELAVFISGEMYGGRKSSAKGIDLEFDREGTRYLVSIKSGPNWGNSSQKSALESDFKNACRVQRQGRHGLNVQAVLGISYGKTRTSDMGVYVRYTGQSFWHFLSTDPSLYIDIIEPIGYRAKQHTEAFEERKQRLERVRGSVHRAFLCG